MSNFGGPAWTGLVGNPVPPRLRAQYFGNPHLGIMLAALLIALEALSYPARRARGEQGVTLAGNLLLHALGAVSPVIVFVWY